MSWFVNSVVEASVIAAAATAIVAVAGLVTTAWTTTRTMRASRDLAHDQRLWERRAEAYRDLVGYSTYLEDRRERFRLLVSPKADRRLPLVEEGLAQPVESYKSSSWDEIKASIRTFASDDVRRAFEAAEHADASLWVAVINHEQSRQAMLKRILLEHDEAGAADESMTRLIEDSELFSVAKKTVDALLAAVRAELQFDRGRH